MNSVNQINMNSQGFIYINNNLKLSALTIITLRKFQEMAFSLYKQCQKCQDDKCLSEVQAKYQAYLQKRRNLQKELQITNEKYMYNYLLCKDLIFENDIKLCRRKIKQKLLEDMAITAKKYNIL